MSEHSSGTETGRDGLERTARLLRNKRERKSHARMNKLAIRNDEQRPRVVVEDIETSYLLWLKENDKSMMIRALRHFFKVCWREFKCAVFRALEFLTEAGLLIDKLEQLWRRAPDIDILCLVKRRAFLNPFECGKALNLETIAETFVSVCINLSDDDVFRVSKRFTKFLVFWCQLLALLKDVRGNRLLKETNGRASEIQTTYVSTPWGIEFYHDGCLRWIE